MQDKRLPACVTVERLHSPCAPPRLIVIAPVSPPEGVPGTEGEGGT